MGILTLHSGRAKKHPHAHKKAPLQQAKARHRAGMDGFTVAVRSIAVNVQ
jgi:hypothetical protein